MLLVVWHVIKSPFNPDIHNMYILQVHSGHHASGKSSKGQAKLRNGGYVRKKQSLYLSITSESLWTDIQEFAKLKYQVSCVWIWLYCICLGRIACLFCWTISCAVWVAGRCKASGEENFSYTKSLPKGNFLLSVYQISSSFSQNSIYQLIHPSQKIT